MAISTLNLESIVIVDQTLSLNGFIIQRTNGLYQSELYDIELYAMGLNKDIATNNLVYKLTRVGFHIDDEIKFYSPTKKASNKNPSILLCFDLTITNSINLLISQLFKANTQFQNLNTTDRNRNFSATKFIPTK